MLLGASYYVNALDGAGEKARPIATNQAEKTSVSVKIKWFGYKQDAVTVHLLANGEKIKSAKIERENKWSYEFKDLPKYDAEGKEITYNVMQEDITWTWRKYKTKVTGDAQNGFVIKNIRLININVGKLWNEYPIDNSPASLLPQMQGANFSNFSDVTGVEREQKQDKAQSVVPIPDSITVKLLADGKVVGTMQLTKENDWESDFEEYPEYDEFDGHEIDYTVEEVFVNGYKSECIEWDYGYSYRIINRSIINIDVEKKWIGKAKGPVEVTLHRKYKVEVYDDRIDDYVVETRDEVVETVELNQGNKWKHTFAGMYEFYVAQYDDASKYDYYVTEKKVDGYKTEIKGDQNTGFVITNENTSDKISIPVEKKWIGKAYGSTKIKLLADGKEVETVELGDGNSWKHTFTGLQKYKNDGMEVKYTVKEVGETNNKIRLGGHQYSVECKGNVADGFIITNKKITAEGFTITNKKNVPPGSTPNTSDSNQLALYTLIIGLSTLLITIIARKRVK